MANNQNLIPANLSSEEAARRGRNGGFKSAQSRRHKRKLSERISLAISIATTKSLKDISKQISELLPNRHLANNKDELKILVAQAKTIKECGFEVYKLIQLVNNPAVDVADALKAINMLWDREEGKAISKIESKEVKEFNGEVKYID